MSKALQLNLKLLSIVLKKNLTFLNFNFFLIIYIYIKKKINPQYNTFT